MCCIFCPGLCAASLAWITWRRVLLLTFLLLTHLLAQSRQWSFVGTLAWSAWPVTLVYVAWRLLVRAARSACGRLRVSVQRAKERRRRAEEDDDDASFVCAN